MENQQTLPRYQDRDESLKKLLELRTDNAKTILELLKGLSIEEVLYTLESVKYDLFKKIND